MLSILASTAVGFFTQYLLHKRLHALSSPEGTFVRVEVLTCQSHLRQGLEFSCVQTMPTSYKTQVYDIVLYPLSVPVI